MIGLALIAAVVILIAWLLGGWAGFVASALICIPAPDDEADGQDAIEVQAIESGAREIGSGE